MTPAEIVLKDMQKYRQKVVDAPHGPKLERGEKPTKEQLVWWEAFHLREIETIDRMIAKQELRVSGREGLLEHSENESDQAEQDQKLSKDSMLRPKEERKNKVRSFFGYPKHSSP